MSYTTIANFWNEVGDFTISRGQLAKIVRKVSRAIESPYEEMKAALATQDRLGIDESGHKNAGKRHWTWCFRAPDFTVFRVDPSRGSEVLRKTLGETFGGVIGCDYFSAYRKYMGDSGATVQFCMAHLIRDIGSSRSTRTSLFRDSATNFSGTCERYSTRFIGRTIGRRTVSRVGWKSFAPRS